MTYRISKGDLARRFKALAEELGWDHMGPAYEPREDGKGSRARIGHTFLEHNSVYGWSINRLVNEGGGESRLKESCEAREMYEWLGGALFATHEMKRERPQ